MYEVTYDRGRKTGVESYRDAGGQLQWEWDRSGEVAIWRQWWPDGTKKAESGWVEGKCEGKAYTWDPDGKLMGEVVFKEGKILEE
jgi:antitoxin component YwqK of YwqJK toxin-antitoxin module